jgi:hypothetical protein
MSSAGGPGKSAYELAVHEEMMDPIMKPVCETALFNLEAELKTMRTQYRSHVGAKDDEGDILLGLEMLSAHWKRHFMTFERKEETYWCCLTLQKCTEYLAGNHVANPSRPTKDDLFKGVYESNRQFRRDWVAFLSHVAAYVELMYQSTEDEAFKLYLNKARLISEMSNKYTAKWWDGYDWSAIKGHIRAAQDKIDTEPPEPPTLWQRFRGSIKAQSDSGRTVGEMLAQLQALSVIPDVQSADDEIQDPSRACASYI